MGEGVDVRIERKDTHTHIYAYPHRPIHTLQTYAHNHRSIIEPPTAAPLTRHTQTRIIRIGIYSEYV